MQWMQFFILYAISVPIFFLIDLLWLGVVASNFYRSRIGHLMEISWGPAIVFYLVFLVGLTFFALYPAVQSNSWTQAIIYGALFGFFTYATYELTNYSTLKDWPLSLVVVDILWGTVLGAFVAGVSYYVYRLFS